MMEKTEKRAEIAKGSLALISSILLESLGVTAVFSVCPLLLFSVGYSKKSYFELVCAYLVVLLGSSVYRCYGMEHQFFEVVLDLYIPVSLLAAGTIWVTMSKMSWQKRLFVAFLPVLIATAAIAVYLCLDRALFTTYYQSYEDVFVVLLEQFKNLFPAGIDAKVLFGIFAIISGILVLPLMLAAVCANCFIYENKKHSKEDFFEEKVAGLEIDQNFIWVFLLSFGLFFLSYLVSMSTVFDIVIEGLFLTTSLVYVIQGFTVLFTWIRRVSEKAKSMSLLLLLCFTALFVPGLSIFVLLGLLLCGVLENFFNLKIRREK